MVTTAKSGDVDFADGVRASLTFLSQSLTYAGLLEGIPTPEMNANTIASARQRHGGVHDPLVIEPVQTPFPLKGPDRFGERALLPRVFCVSEYKWASDYYLTLIWWQEEWALPIDGTVAENIRQVAWRDVAYEFAD